MSIEENKKPAARFYDDVWNPGKLGHIDNAVVPPRNRNQTQLERRAE